MDVTNDDTTQKDIVDISEIYTHVDLYREMDFVKQDCLEIKNDIPKDSLTLIGENKRILKWCESKTKIISGRTILNKYKICKLTNDRKVKYRYNNGEYQVYSHAYGWDKAKNSDFKKLSYERKKYAEEHNLQEFVYKGFGTRDEMRNKSLADFVYEYPIEDKYYQQTYSTENNCVWLSTAILVKSIDQKDGDWMIDLFLKDKVKFEWMNIKTQKKNKANVNISLKYASESLQEKLQRDVGYALKSVQKPVNGCYKEWLINTNIHGKYVVMLKMGDGEYSHVVGVDCDKNLIYDCMEKYALELNSDNFDFCGGKEDVKVKCIPICFELVDNGKKRPWNT